MTRAAGAGAERGDRQKRAEPGRWRPWDLCGYALLAGLLCGAALASPQHRLVGAGADPIQRLWFLAWLPFAAGHHLSPLVTTYLDHPLRVNLMWNNATPLLGLLAWPVTSAVGPVVAYDLLMALALTLSAWTASLVCARYVRHHLPAAVAGLLYGFSPYMVAEAAGGHLPLVAAVTPPLLLALLDEICVRQRRPPAGLGLGLGLVCCAQLLLGEELLTTGLLVACLTLLLLAFGAPRRAVRQARRAAPALAVASLTAIAGSAVPLLTQLGGPGRLTGASLQPAGVFVTDLANLVVPTRLLVLAPHAAVALSSRFTAGLGESGAYLGLPLLAALAAAVALRRRERWTWLLLAVTAAVLVASLGPVLHVAGRSTRIALPWRLLEGLPLLRNVLPARLVLFAFLGAALLLALGLDRVQERRPGRVGVALAAAVALLALVPLLPRTLPSSPAVVPAFFRSRAVDRLAQGSVVAVAPVPTIRDARAMLWQVASGMRFQMPWGYVIHRTRDGAAQENRLSPPLARALVTIEFGGRPSRAGAIRPAIAQELRREQVGWVVVGPMAHEGRAATYVSAALGERPRRIAGIDLWRVGPGAVRRTGPGAAG
ncbi:MAG TPA: hypothetical protein VNN74_06090 [Candidatus Micrarchaeia archaeon]|nr:hypothetical protein [Candidatus Micrarchaeia archaeon]